MNNVLAIAERVNNPTLSDDYIASWREKWTSTRLRLRCIMSVNGMAHGSGPTRDRLENKLGLPESTKVINLLWPDNKCGTWDAEEAGVSAVAVMEYIAADRAKEYARVVLLGRRVAKAFHLPGDAPWGGTFALSDSKAGWAENPRGPFMLLPHPSGRSSVLNDPGESAAIAAKVKRFLAA